MNKEKLLQGILNLPTIDVGTAAKYGQIFTGEQGKVHFGMTRERILGEFSVFSLCISGPEKARLAFIKKMAVKLGEPAVIQKSPEFPDSHVVLWRARSVEEKLSQNNRKKNSLGRK